MTELYPFPYMGLSPMRRREVDRFRCYLNNSTTLVRSNAGPVRMAIAGFLVGCRVSTAKKKIIEEYFQDIKNKFTNSVLQQGLYEQVKDTQALNLSATNGVDIVANNRDGFIKITLSKGEKGNKAYRHLTFVCKGYDPHFLSLFKCRGTAADFDMLLDGAAACFGAAISIRPKARRQKQPVFPTRHH